MLTRFLACLFACLLVQMTYLLKLSEDISRLISAIDGSIGIYALHSEKGAFFSLNEKMMFPLASTYKLPIGICFLKKVDQGFANLNDMIEVHSEDIPESSSILDHRHFSYPGVLLSLENLVRLMFEYSDNTASDLILRRTGGTGEVMKMLKEYGLPQIRIDRSIQQIFSEAAQHPKAALLSQEKDSGTPEGMVKLLSLVLDRKILSESSTKFLLECMHRCKTGDQRIRALLPPGTRVANKTGTAIGFVNDLAIVDLPNGFGKLILAVYIKETWATQQKSEETIARIARALYDHALLSFQTQN